MAAATSLAVHGLALVWILRSAPLPEIARPPIPLALVAVPEDIGRASGAIAPSAPASTAPPPHGAPRRPATRKPLSTPAASQRVEDKPAPQVGGDEAQVAAPLVTGTPAGRQSSAARQIFGESEVDLPARPIARVQPHYPEHARLMARESDVKLAVTVEADGAVSNVELVQSGGEEFDREAREALEHTHFEPARRAGTPVAALVRFTVRFRLDD